MKKTWDQWAALAIAVILFVAVAWLLVGCEAVASLPPVEVCYVHPKYGEVCVVVGGGRFFKATLTPAQKEEVEAWLETQGAPK